MYYRKEIVQAALARSSIAKRQHLSVLDEFRIRRLSSGRKVHSQSRSGAASSGVCTARPLTRYHEVPRRVGQRKSGTGGIDEDAGRAGALRAYCLANERVTATCPSLTEC